MRRYFQNINIQKWMPVLLSVFTALLALYWMQSQTADQNRADTTPRLPKECDGFELIGNLKNASVVLLGEIHTFQNITLSCLLSLLATNFSQRNPNPSTVYLEGVNTDNKVQAVLEGTAPLRFNNQKETQSVCKKANRCRTWENERALTETHMRVEKMLELFYNSQIQLDLQKIGGPNDDSLKYQFLVSSMLNKNTYVSNLMDIGIIVAPKKREWIIKTILNALIQSYENRKKIVPSGLFNFFDKAMDNYFNRERHNLPIVCKEILNYYMGDCYYKEVVLPSMEAGRNKFLEKNIRTELNKKEGVAFFVAGRNHANEMVHRMPNEPRMAILNWKRI